MSIISRLVGVVLVLVGLSGCAGGSEKVGGEDEQALAPDRSFKAEINYETGEIFLPSEKYKITWAEYTIIDNASQHFLAECINENSDYDYPYLPTPSYQKSEDRRFGIWKIDNAQQVGYTLPRTEAEQERLDRADAEEKELAELSETAREVLSKAESDCAESLSKQPISQNKVPKFPTLPSGYSQAYASEEGASIHAEWEACLNENGLELDPEVSPFAIKGITGEKNEQDIKIAVIDVQCKTEVDYIHRMANLVAAYEGPYVKKYESELQEYYDAQLVVLESAKEYIAKNIPDYTW